MMKKSKRIVIGSDKDEVEIYGDQENQQIEMDIAQYPVEEGGNLVDNARFNSNEINISGYVSGKDLAEANKNATKIYDWQKDVQIIHVRNGVTDWSYLVRSFNKRFEDGRQNAVYIDVTIVKIRKPVGSFAGMKNSGKKQASAAPAQTWVTVVGGNTYWGWSMRYGTSIQQLRNWNHWPDRFIPIGARARVK